MPETLVPGASPRLVDYLSRHGVRRDASLQSPTRLRAGVLACGLDEESWQGLFALEASWGGLLFAPWPGPPAMRLGPAMPLLIGAPWRDIGRGASELPESEAPPWPRMRCLEHELWLCGTTEEIDLDFAADARGRVYTWDREIDELKRLADGGLQALEGQAVVAEASLDFGRVSTLVFRDVLDVASIASLGLGRISEASGAVSSFFRGERSLVRIQPAADPNVAETRMWARDKAELCRLARACRAVGTPVTKLILIAAGADGAASARALRKAGIDGLEVWR